MEVNFLPKSDLFELPRKSSIYAAYFNCKATSVDYLGDEVWEYSLGFATSFSESGWKGVIYPHYSLNDTDFVMQYLPTIITEDNGNEWKVQFRFIGDPQYIKQQPYIVGDVVCQIGFEKIIPVYFNVIEK